MARVEMDLSRYRPTQEKKWERNSDGSIEAEIYTFVGVVRVFTYPGDGGAHRCFTNLSMYINPFIYRATLDRHYHERWLRRLAGEFAEQCAEAERRDRG